VEEKKKPMSPYRFLGGVWGEPKKKDRQENEKKNTMTMIIVAILLEAAYIIVVMMAGGTLTLFLSASLAVGSRRFYGRL
jgi:hypothetical protein